MNRTGNDTDGGQEDCVASDRPTSTVAAGEVVDVLSRWQRGRHGDGTQRLASEIEQGPANEVGHEWHHDAFKTEATITSVRWLRPSSAAPRRDMPNAISTRGTAAPPAARTAGGRRPASGMPMMATRAPAAEATITGLRQGWLMVAGSRPCRSRRCPGWSARRGRESAAEGAAWVPQRPHDPRRSPRRCSAWVPGPACEVLLKIGGSVTETDPDGRKLGCSRSGTAPRPAHNGRGCSG